MKKLLIALVFSTITFLFTLSVFAAEPKGIVVHIGDSLTTGMYSSGGIINKYKEAGFDPIIPGANPSGDGSCYSGFIAGYPCHALVGGASPSGIEAIDINSEKIKEASTIVFAMGTNKIESDEAFKDGMAQAATKVRALNPNIKIYWVNLVAKKEVTSYSTRNQAILDGAKANNIIVIDWFHKVFPDGDPVNILTSLEDKNGYFPPKGDGIHLSGDGYQAMADTIVSGITSGGSAQQPLVAEAFYSTCVITKVGNPQGPPPPCIEPDFEITPGTGDGTHPVAPEVADGNYIQAIKDTFGVTVEGGFDGDTYNAYKIMWEKFHDVSNTNFMKLIKGATIRPINGGSFMEQGCIINIRNTIENETLFKVILIHELGHIIYHCAPNSAHIADHENALYKEGGITAYGDAPCYGNNDYNRRTEDYAEMIAYYLNPTATEQTNCGANGNVPFANGKKPLHLEVVKKILGEYNQ